MDKKEIIKTLATAIMAGLSVVLIWVALYAFGL